MGGSSSHAQHSCLRLFTACSLLSCTHAQINGLVFDGANTAGVGLDHDSKNQYESRVVHQNLAFLRFTAAGIRTGHAQFVASAEMTFTNCLFAYNYAGVFFGSWK